MLIVQMASGVMGAILGAIIAALAGTGPLLVLGAGVLGLFLTLLFTPLHASWAVLAYLNSEGPDRGHRHGTGHGRCPCLRRAAVVISSGSSRAVV